MPVSFFGGSSDAASRRGPQAVEHCIKCGHALLAGQTRCPECGSVTAPPRASRRHVPTQLYQLGPQVVRPIAARFTIMAVAAAAGPALLLIGVVLDVLFGVGLGLGLVDAAAVLAISLPVVIAISMPFGRGSLGGRRSPVPVSETRLAGMPIHRIALALAPSWWALAALGLLGSATPATVLLSILAMIAAVACAYFHLSWMADLGLAISDDGPHGVLNICVGTAILAAIIALVVALFVSSWAPFVGALSVVLLAVVIGEISVSVQLARAMISTLVGAYEELGREERRARRAAEHGPRFPT